MNPIDSMKFVTILITLGLLTAIAGTTATPRADSRIANPENPSKQVPQYRKLSRTKFGMNPLELSIHDRVNQYRQSQNLPPLTLDPTISAQARTHSANMANTSRLSHDGFKGRVDAIAKTIAYRGAAENVAYNMGHTSPDDTAVKGWIKSPGHQRNMVGRYDLTGIGVVKNDKGEYYFTQIFIRKK
jgi:uncharacterized protein YkwD